jgi:O-antigen/teichoic acid export membrane protein
VLVGRTLGLQILTAGVTVVLARLLTPSDYGLFAVALAVQLVGQRAAELGLPAALVRMDEQPPAALQASVAGVLLVTSSSLAVLLLLAAFVIAPAFGGSHTLEVIAVAGCAIPFYAARAMPMVMMERELRFGRVAIVETADTLAFNGFALLGAIAGLGAFSLAGAVPFGGLAGGLTAWAIQPFARRPSLALAPVRPLAGFGVKVSALQGVYLLKELGFVTIVAAIGGTSVAGFYAMAKRLFSFPIALTSAVGRVSFPALSRDPEGRAARAAKIATYTAIAAGLPLALVAGAIQPLISVVLGDEWLPTTDIVLIGSLGMMLTASANATMVGFALAEGKAGGPLLAAVVETVVAFTMAATLTASLGEVGVGLTLTISMLAASVAFASSTDATVRRSLFGVAKACVIAALAAGFAQLLDLSEDPAGLVVSLVAVFVVWLGLGLLFSRAEIARVVQLAKPILGRTAAA